MTDGLLVVLFATGLAFVTIVVAVIVWWATKHDGPYDEDDHSW